MKWQYTANYNKTPVFLEFSVLFELYNVFLILNAHSLK